MIIKKNIIRRSYFFYKILFKSVTRLVNLNKLPHRRKNKKTNSLFILMRPNNTFLTLTGSVKLHNITAGSSGFKGPKRSSPYSRHVVARNMSYYMYFNKLLQDPVDLYFNSEITRKYFFFFKGLVTKAFDVRYIIKNKLRAHGYLRNKKKRRT